MIAIYIYTLTQVPLEVLVNLRYLYQDKGNRGKRTLKIYPKLSKPIIYRHAKKTVADKTVNHTKHNPGGPRKISPPDKRLILRQIPKVREKYRSFAIKQLRVSSGVKKDVSNKTVRHVLHGADYRYLNSRKKGLLKKDDLKKRCELPVKLPKCY